MDNGHLINSTVAGDTSYARIDVTAVVKIDIIWKFVNLNPLHWFIFIVAFLQFLNVGAVGFDNFMTIHTDFCRGNGCCRSSFYIDMTISAVYAQLSGMEFVAVGNGLLWGIAYVGIFGR